jgi:purine nucleosidase
MSPRNVVIDCDPGIDDAFALALAFASPELKILGITTTFGNVGLELTTQNALRIVDWFDVDIPVYAGISQPLLGKKVDATAYHGESGLHAPRIPKSQRKAESKHAVDFLISTLLASEQPITIVAIGPLTNIAVAVRMRPDIVERIDEIVMMGGSTDYGNDSPAAEFNMLRLM